MSLLRPILTAHFCRKQCANANPTTQVVFTYNCFETIVRLIYKVRFALEVYRKHIHSTLKSHRVNRSLLGRILLVSAGFKDKSYTIFVTCIKRTALCCGHLALSTSSKAFPTLTGKHGPSEKLESWRH